MTHKVQISFTDEQWEIIKKLKGHLGKTDTDAVRNIVISWLSEKSILSTTIKNEMLNSKSEE